MKRRSVKMLSVSAVWRNSVTAKAAKMDLPISKIVLSLSI